MRTALVMALVTALTAGCSSAEEAAAPPATPDEERALAEARAMIPASELPPETPAATESPRDDQ